MAVLITGGTGFVGKRLVPMFDNVFLTTRNPLNAMSQFGDAIEGAIEWGKLDEPLSFDGCGRFETVINLMGESIAEGRWNADKKRRIRDSRVLGTRRLVDALLQQNQPPKVFVSTSAVGYYGNRGDELLDESSPMGEGFLVDVCDEWERVADRLENAGVRVIKIRVGIVLGNGGGALEKMVPPFKFCVGGKLGSGKQYLPWIHIDDLCKMYHWAATNESVAGVLNGSAPNPVTNSEFTKQLAKRLGRPAFLAVPGFALRLVLGEFANSLLASQRVVPNAAIERGFEFQFETLAAAIKDLIRG